MSNLREAVCALTLISFVLSLPVLAQQQQQPPSWLATEKGVATERIKDVKLFSKSLNREVTYRVILPASYGSTARRYPVLYLLNGFTGSYQSWERGSNITEVAEDYDLIIVGVEGANSWYADSVTEPNEQWETYFIRDVIPDVTTRFRVNRGEYASAVAGISAGAFGAINIALKYPYLFAFAASLSGPMDAMNDKELNDYKEFGVEKIFGPMGSKTREQNDPFKHAEKADPVTANATFFYFLCGTEEECVPSTRRFVDVLRKKKIAYEYREMPGGHEWTLWADAIPGMMQSLARRMPLVRIRR
jgi:putative tributyrin esterase